MIIEDKSDIQVLFFALRYALGRQTASVDIVIRKLKENWNNLEPIDKEQIVTVIESYYVTYKSNRPTESIYEDSWNKFREWCITKMREDKINYIV